MYKKEEVEKEGEKMREIKFRAWEKNLEEIIPVHSINFENKIINTESAWRTFNEIELMQFTGLKDCNGKEIFEGDIICETYEDTQNIGVVYFVDGTFKVNFDNCEDYSLLGCDLEQTKTIGNVFKNKDKYKKLYDFFVL